MQQPDYITRLGSLVIDHRLRRILDHLLEAQAQVYAQEDIHFEPRWTSTFLLLEEEGPLGVTEIARRLQYTHPGIIKFTNGMIAADLIIQLDDPQDERRRLLQLSPRGKRLAPRLHRIWGALREAQSEIFKQAGCEVLNLLQRVDLELAKCPLAERVMQRLEKE